MNLKQEETGLCPVFPLALRGKAFGFSVLSKHAVMTPVRSIFSLIAYYQVIDSMIFYKKVITHAK
jgi:hypothetical protein